MALISTAKQFYDMIIAGGFAALENLVTIKQHETEWLDFKSGSKLDHAEMTWSRAICGFANNQGGVLIWGIDARRDPKTEVDAAQSIDAVDNPAALRSRLITLVTGAVEPPVTGIEVREVFQVDANGPGLVVCFVPESQNKPHRDERAKNKPYMLRVSASFEMIGPSLLRSLFYPRSVPVLEMDVQPKWNLIELPPHSPIESMAIHFDVTIRNIGGVTAKDIFIVIATFPPLAKISRTYHSTHEMVGNLTQGLLLKRPVHPSSKEYVCELECTASVYKAGFTPNRFTPRIDRFIAKFDVFAADMQPLHLSVEFDESEIQDKTQKTAVPLSDT